MEEQLKVEMMAMDNNGVAHFKGFRFGHDLTVNLKILFPGSLKIYYSCLWANRKNNSCILQTMNCYFSLFHTAMHLLLIMIYYYLSLTSDQTGSFCFVFYQVTCDQTSGPSCLNLLWQFQGPFSLSSDICLYREIVEGFWCTDKSGIHDQHFYQNCQTV